MSALLLDTHVLVWLMEGNQKLSTYCRLRVEEERGNKDVLISAITPWEIALLVSKNRIQLHQDVGQWVDAALALPGIRLFPLLPAIAISSTRLPFDAHPDPADRILMATAIHTGATLVTADEQILKYSAQGWLNCLRAEQ